MTSPLPHYRHMYSSVHADRSAPVGRAERQALRRLNVGLEAADGALMLRWLLALPAAFGQERRFAGVRFLNNSPNHPEDFVPGVSVILKKNVTMGLPKVLVGHGHMF